MSHPTRKAVTVLAVVLTFFLCFTCDQVTGSAKDSPTEEEEKPLPSSNADLSALQVSLGTLTPAFDPGTTEYTVALLDASSITVTPTAADSAAEITVDANIVVSGSPCEPIILAAGEKAITIVVTAPDGTTKTYTVTVTVTCSEEENENGESQPDSDGSSPVPDRAYVVNQGSDTVTYFVATTGAYLNQTLENSSFVVATSASDKYPEDVAVSSGTGLVYVTVGNDNRVVYLDYETGAYAFGSLENSSFVTGTYPKGVAVHPMEDILYVVNRDSHSVTYFNAVTGAYLNGTLENSSFDTGPAPQRVAVNCVDHLIYVTCDGDDTVTYLDALTGSHLNGTVENSSFSTAGDSPQRVAVNPVAGLVYVTAFVQDVIFYDAETGAFFGGEPGSAVFTTGPYARGIAVDPDRNMLYVSNLDPPQYVTRFNASTGAYIGADLADASTNVESSAFGLAVHPENGILYVAGTSTDTLILLDADTGAFLNGTLANSSFATGSNPYAVAVVW